MKIACSSAAFARSFADGTLTQLEWLDVCANELEVDGVVFEREHFPRTDCEYLAQLKKMCADLGLGVAAVDYGARLWDDRASFALALALGAPLLIGQAPPATDDPSAWGAFAAAAGDAARAAKDANVTLALGNAAGTLCADGADLKRLAKDVDSAWLRYALDVEGLTDADVTTLLPRAVLARARADAPHRADQIARLARFRGYVMLDLGGNAAARDAYHRAVATFVAERSRALAGATG